MQMVAKRKTLEEEIKRFAVDRPGELRKTFLLYADLEIQQKELKRAKYIFERAMGSSIHFENDVEFWLRYTKFVTTHLKDVSSVRAMFE